MVPSGSVRHRLSDSPAEKFFICVSSVGGPEGESRAGPSARAVDETLPRFPTFKVAMRKGVFWRYLEPNDRPGPFVEPDIAIPVCPCPFRTAAAI